MRISMIAIVVLSTFVFSFGQSMKVHTKGSTTPATYSLGAIDSITFELQSPTPTNGLVAYYPFAGNAADSSGNSNNGTITGSAVLTADRFGNANSSYQFGTTGNINCGNPTILQTASMSAAFWIKYTDALPGIANMTILCKSTKGSDGYNVCLTGNVILAEFSHSGIWDNFGGHSIPNPPIEVNKWYFFAISYDSASQTATEYFNNQKLGSFVFQMAPPTSHALTFGTGYIAHYPGILDDVRIYNRALSDQEFLSLYGEKGWTGN